ncbi:MAG: MFS transporter, partial [Clostridia bacterium]|nr:MFS transporter [Clostridia bacterium]
MKKKNLYPAALALYGLAVGMSDGVMANYFRDVYGVSAYTRGVLQFPRELPGVLGVLAVAGLPFLNDLRLAALAQICSCIGIGLLGLYTPQFSAMMALLFLFSSGLHLFTPLQDSIG